VRELKEGPQRRGEQKRRGERERRNREELKAGPAK